MRSQIPSVALDDEQGVIDLRERDRVARAVTEIRPTQVIHLAAQSFVPESFQNPQETIDINFIGTLNLLNALKAAGFSGRMLFIGSGDMYGRVSEIALPVSENHPLKPRSPYAVSKVAAEALCYQWSQTEGFEVMMARPFNHIGPGQSERFVVADFARQLVLISKGGREPIIEVGDIDVTRDFSDVRDVVRAYQAILERGRSGEVYNVCSGSETKVRDVLQALIRISGVSVSIQTKGERTRPSEQKRMFGSYEKLKAETGWQPAISLEQSLQDVYDYWGEKCQ